MEGKINLGHGTETIRIATALLPMGNSGFGSIMILVFGVAVPIMRRGRPP
jgi:hypothetical protein